jgi:lipopolysaccharide biosynthesis regulator YciM
MYHDFAVKNSELPPAEFRQLARQAAARAKNGVMIEDLGRMEARDGNLAAAVSNYQQARSIYTKRDDILRVVLEEAEAWRKQGKAQRGLELVRSVLKIVSDSPTVALLKKLEQELGGSAPSEPGAKR